jgi:hypothetical protein
MHIVLLLLLLLLLLMLLLLLDSATCYLRMLPRYRMKEGGLPVAFTDSIRIEHDNGVAADVMTLTLPSMLLPQHINRVQVVVEDTMQVMMMMFLCFVLFAHQPSHRPVLTHVAILL